MSSTHLRILDTLVGEIDTEFDDSPTPKFVRPAARPVSEASVLSPAVRGETQTIRLRFEAKGFTSEAVIDAERLDAGLTIGRRGAPEVAEALRSMFFGPVSRVHAVIRREGRTIAVYPVTSGSGIWRGGLPRERTALLPGESVQLTAPGSSPVYMRWVE